MEKADSKQGEMLKDTILGVCAFIEKFGFFIKSSNSISFAFDIELCHYKEIYVLYFNIRS